MDKDACMNVWLLVSRNMRERREIFIRERQARTRDGESNGPGREGQRKWDRGRERMGNVVR